jgi:hypothetical protein
VLLRIRGRPHGTVTSPQQRPLRHDQPLHPPDYHNPSSTTHSSLAPTRRRLMARNDDRPGGAPRPRRRCWPCVSPEHRPVGHRPQVVRPAGHACKARVQEDVPVDRVIDLDELARRLTLLRPEWERIAQVGPFTWRDEQAPWPQRIMNDRAAVKVPESLGVRLRSGDDEAEIVVWAGLLCRRRHALSRRRAR